MRGFLLSLLVLFSAPAFAIGGAPQVAEQKVALAVTLSVQPAGNRVLTVTNLSTAPLRAAHPLSRGALSFLVSDAQGNPVAPVFAAKVDPAAQEATFTPGEAEPFGINLEMVTGTGLARYRLEKGAAYRVVAVYRPAGLAGPGFASNETVFVYTGLPEGMPEGTPVLTLTCKSDDDCRRFKPACGAGPCTEGTPMQCRDNACVIQ